jgi:hypothetical protein
MLLMDERPFRGKKRLACPDPVAIRKKLTYTLIQDIGSK